MGKQKQKEFAEGSQWVVASPLLCGRCLRCLLCACVGPLFGADRGSQIRAAADGPATAKWRPEGASVTSMRLSKSAGLRPEIALEVVTRDCANLACLTLYNSAGSFRLGVIKQPLWRRRRPPLGASFELDFVRVSIARLRAQVVPGEGQDE